MAKRPYIKLYVDDFFGSFKVQGMNAEQIGAYFLMLMAASQEPNIDLLDDDNYLAQVTRLGKNFKKNSHVLKNCFVSENGHLYNTKLRKVLVEYDNFVERQRVKSVKGVEARQPTGNPRVTQTQPTGNPTKTKTNNHNHKPKAYIKEEEYRVILTPLPFSNNVKKALMMHFKQRVDIKKPLTERAAKLLIKPIEGWVSTYGEASVIAQIEYSIKNSYQDIYEPKKAIETQVYVQPPKRVEQTEAEKQAELDEITERLKKIK